MGKDLSEGNVMQEGFSPARRGRRPIVDIRPICEDVRKAQPKWVMYEVRSSAEANSVLRQMGKMAGFEAASEVRDDGGKNVYIRFKPGRTL